MEKITKEQWVDTVATTPILGKRVLRKFLQRQSARRYTQILDEFFIMFADKYDGMPEIKIVLEDWLEYVSNEEEQIRDYITEFFKFMPKEKQQRVMDEFLESIHKTHHTETILMKISFFHSFSEANNDTNLTIDKIIDFLEPIDEFEIKKTSLYYSKINKEYTATIVIENHASITKEHINALTKDLIKYNVIDNNWKLEN